jgi:hypothetical protein
VKWPNPKLLEKTGEELGSSSKVTKLNLNLLWLSPIKRERFYCIKTFVAINASNEYAK